jgi:regulator of protease activity HflC (stomatin/prohibitin superfamily)
MEWFALGVVVLYVLKGLRLLYQYERGVVFTLGKFRGVRAPACASSGRSSSRCAPWICASRPPTSRGRRSWTRDNIPVLINTVVYFKVVSPEDAIIEIEDYVFAVQQYTQAALRDVVGNHELDFVLTEREDIAGAIGNMVEQETGDWGVAIESIKIQEIELPADMKRAMARQAEAERERRAIIIASEGELAASENLRGAAVNLSQSDGALHLRTLQTIRDIAADPSEKIVLFMPADMGRVIGRLVGGD